MMTDDDLDSLFAAARAAPAQPSAALSFRVLADAAEERPRPVPAMVRPARPGFLARLGTVFGGGGALAGMVTATLAGFWIGFAQPADFSLMAAVLNAETAEIDLMPGIDALLDEAP